MVGLGLGLGFVIGACTRTHARRGKSGSAVSGQGRSLCLLMVGIAKPVLHWTGMGNKHMLQRVESPCEPIRFLVISFDRGNEKKDIYIFLKKHH